MIKTAPTNTNCPICQQEIVFSPRYPNRVCNDCFELATDIAGRKLLFYNVSASGGFQAFFADNNAVYDSHICYINGIKCWADEARFGGIVIEVK